ncbi:MAG TPA: 4-hydroxythreonine-4-phosphate dehydrogenase PdxA [Holophagaceae bacterium]|nr:4-hydroxythreonine-4-phosphate dehydrogenase PdxA [Holophagaceae bacterium]
MRNLAPRRPRIAITLGDPCGVGPEILLGVLHALHAWADILVIGARAGADLLEGSTDQRVHWRWGHPQGPVPEGFKGEAYGIWTSTSRDFHEPRLAGQALWLDPTPDVTRDQLALGQGSAASGRAAVEAVKTAARLVMAGEADALVTLPLAKSAAHLAGYDIPGHTELLQQLAGSPITRMAFVSPRLSVVLHTVHQSLRSVVENLDADAVAETLSFAADRFIQFTGKKDLRVALCALNPHAGENGAFGSEELLLQDALVQAEASFLDFAGDPTGPYAEVVSPFSSGPIPEGWEIFPSTPAPFGGGRDIEVVSRGHREEVQAAKPAPRFFGPLPADSLFHRAARGEFDLVVALYHDQGLIPMKVLEPARAVNLTLGLPFIRTSPDHGTAFDKAGKWVADPTNFLEATALAVRLAGRAKGAAWQAEVHPGL